MNIYQSKNLAVITMSRFTTERIQPATGLVAFRYECMSSGFGTSVGLSPNTGRSSSV